MVTQLWLETREIFLISYQLGLSNERYRPDSVPGKKRFMARSILARISSAHDLHAADAIYHKACDINFRTMRQIPTGFRKEKL